MLYRYYIIAQDYATLPYTKIYQCLERKSMSFQFLLSARYAKTTHQTEKHSTNSNIILGNQGWGFQDFSWVHLLQRSSLDELQGDETESIV